MFFLTIPRILNQVKLFFNVHIQSFLQIKNTGVYVYTSTSQNSHKVHTLSMQSKIISRNNHIDLIIYHNVFPSDQDYFI